MDEQNTRSAEDISLEEAFARLDTLIERMESREISLEDSFQLYKEGMDLLKTSKDKIDTVEKKMQQINADGEINDF
ncbi:MAG: exodeoxyribonuclease VII small subunit [Eubacteriales bacterium]|nr:exodeoxyribonuclease VII small subunit [Eubacteriales bacterium]